MESTKQNQGNWEDPKHENEKLHGEINSNREKIRHLEEIVRVQRLLIDSIEKEKQTFLETIKGLESKLAGYTKAQLVRVLTDAEKNSTYSFGSVIKAYND
ncbi:hypothetical protein BH11BAC4_BH11BAC4_07640 [soil metagenome]